ncbi:hypothetical protein AB0I69_45775 [Streptomyces sp. NPDC050508]|uniref:hypothetical protein n=1 Tax=Streptomyces sp. NPDC050508 TaxID=3155405 RepID=UPI00341E7786
MAISTAPGTNWGTWTNLEGTIVDVPSAALNADGRIQVFFRGTDDALWYFRNQGTLYEMYTGTTSLGGAVFATPSPVLDGSGRIVVAVKGAGDTLYTIQQQSWNSADTWEAFSSETTGVTSRPTAAVDASAHAQIFYCGSDGAAWRVGQSDNYDSFETS